jgi:transcriptional regulator with XRE-family HTH domain
MAQVLIRPFGELLRDWRRHRRMSQLELALAAEISPRHLSFVETNRSKPSREMVLHLSEQLEVPLRDRNQLLLAAGYAPVFSETSLDDASMAEIRAALRSVLGGHEPYPALIVDRHWNLIDANASASLLMAGASESLLAPPCNVLRLSLHPLGVAPRIANLGEWRSHVLERVRRDAVALGDPVLAQLHEELRAYPCDEPPAPLGPAADIVVPLRVRHDGTTLSFFSTVTRFGSALDLTLAELSIESFYPADSATAGTLSRKP